MRKAVIQAALDLLADEVGGEWILVGGSLARIAFGSSRSTEDVDVFAKNPVEPNASRAQLFGIADRLGMPVEALNSAADFFVRALDGWEGHLVLLRGGFKGKVYRPDLTLFLALKLQRATEADLLDCRAALKSCPPAELDLRVLRNWLAARKLNKAAARFLDHLSEKSGS